MPRCRRQASGVGWGMPLALPMPHITSGMSSITTSGRIFPASMQRRIISPTVTTRSSWPGQDVVFEQLASVRGDHVEQLLAERAQERILGREMAVHGADAHVGAPCHVVHLR